MAPSSPTPWESLDRSDQERVVLLLGSLAEFAAGFNVATGFTQFTSNPQDPPIRFLYQSLHQYLHAYFMDAPGTGVLPVLRSIGLADEAGEIEALLATPMGRLTLRGLLVEYRNKILAHPRYSTRIIFHSIYEPAVIESDEVLATFGAALHHLYWTTVALHGRLRSAYPEADRIDRERHGFPLDRELPLIQ